jgi:gamma-glutamylputrescine oxidase
MTVPSYWERTAWRKPYDLVIIGAGITGSSTALFHLRANPGASVVLLERSAHPSGASTRNAGFTCVGTVGEGLDDLANESEAEVVDRIRRRFEGLELLRRELPAEETGHRMTGGHELFLDETDFERCAAEIPRFNRYLRDITGHSEVYKADHVNGKPAIAIAIEGHLHSGKLMQALHRRVREAGGRIQWGMPVASVEPGEVRLGSGETLEARTILVATNGFTGAIPDMPVVHPARGLVMVVTGEGIGRWTGSWHAERGFTYWRDVDGGLLIGGGRHLDISGERTMEPGVNPVIRQYLWDFLHETLGVRVESVTDQWNGVMGFPDGRKTPHLAEVKPGVWVAAGLSGMGVALGMSLGKEVASKMLNVEG